MRVLNVMAPGGFERYFEEVERLPAPDPPSMAEIAARYDLEAV